MEKGGKEKKRERMRGRVAVDIGIRKRIGEGRRRMLRSRIENDVKEKKRESNSRWRNRKEDGGVKKKGTMRYVELIPFKHAQVSRSGVAGEAGGGGDDRLC